MTEQPAGYCDKYVAVGEDLAFLRIFDAHALCTQVIALVRCGRLGNIVVVLPKVFPGVHSPPTPYGMPFAESLKTEVRHLESRLGRALALVRGVSLRTVKLESGKVPSACRAMTATAAPADLLPSRNGIVHSDTISPIQATRNGAQNIPRRAFLGI